jgi:ribosomal protein S13
LLSVPGLGRVKIKNMLERQSISPAKMLAGLTEGQRDRLVEEISHYYKR